LAKEIGLSNVSISHLKRGKRTLNRHSRTLIKAFLEIYFRKSGIDSKFFSPNFAISNMREKKASNLRSYIQNFLLAKQVEGKSEATLIFYRENLDRFIWWLGQNNFKEDTNSIDANIMRAFLAYVQTGTNRWGVGSKSSERKASMSTVDAYWRTLQSLFTWLVKENIIKLENNPIKKIPRPKVPQKVVQDIPLELIRKALFKFGTQTFIGVRNSAILLMLLDTGIRLSECANLDLFDINLANGQVRVWGKGAKQRLVRLGNTAMLALKRYLDQRPDVASPRLWITKNGKPLAKSGIQIVIRRLSKLGGNVRWSPHTFRNTFAINYLRAGGDPFTLQILGGWTDLEMPRHYTAALKAEDAFRIHARASPADRMASGLDL
jgi:site-specific recombinase XerD